MREDIHKLGTLCNYPLKPPIVLKIEAFSCTVGPEPAVPVPNSDQTVDAFAKLMMGKPTVHSNINIHLSHI